MSFERYIEALLDETAKTEKVADLKMDLLRGGIGAAAGGAAGYYTGEDLPSTLLGVGGGALAGVGAGRAMDSSIAQAVKHGPTIAKLDDRLRMIRMAGWFDRNKLPLGIAAAAGSGILGGSQASKLDDVSTNKISAPGVPTTLLSGQTFNQKIQPPMPVRKELLPDAPISPFVGAGPTGLHVGMRLKPKKEDEG